MLDIVQPVKPPRQTPLAQVKTGTGERGQTVRHILCYREGHKPDVPFAGQDPVRFAA